ncbi:ABC-type Fe3+/spermidine/putrescine transport systems, ATPase components [Pustulibacterium marinum]|uniref:ABC-type Fe3+/spermidine/putrescine transport systems, ATPase components n=1 Tax=Pustulibacterium marinum TaxID=1224947 RepID=A0A1I7EUI7_9FLAO|nr:ABC transporter ATP-binding protein [Pustulibacterium marinum]SFU27596.1 ABC-type Fe3+/spermidine/putrescine transport systems, ATPase components [Pustulibacterium marinum]
MLSIENISFAYAEKPILKDVSFRVEKGEHIAIMGESGCGKSTLLRCIYGLFDLEAGKIFYNETPVLGPAYNLVPGMDYMKYLAQDFDLMPFLTVAQNIGKHLSNFYPEEKKQRIQELLEMVEMTEFANVKAKLLSGGQMQRVALARAIAVEPEVLLLDEPFSHIDSFQKNSLRRNLFAHLKKHNITCLVATHDKEESLPFSDKTLVMKDGEVLTFENPKVLYQNPTNAYVASLFGDVNVLDGKDFDTDKNELICYPHQLEIVASGGVQVLVKSCYFQGDHYLVLGELNGKKITLKSSEEITSEHIQIQLKK